MALAAVALAGGAGAVVWNQTKFVKKYIDINELASSLEVSPDSLRIYNPYLSTEVENTWIVVPNPKEKPVAKMKHGELGKNDDKNVSFFVDVNQDLEQTAAIWGVPVSAIHAFNPRMEGKKFAPYPAFLQLPFTIVFRDGELSNNPFDEQRRERLKELYENYHKAMKSGDLASYAVPVASPSTSSLDARLKKMSDEGYLSAETVTIDGLPYRRMTWRPGGITVAGPTAYELAGRLEMNVDSLRNLAYLGRYAAMRNAGNEIFCIDDVKPYQAQLDTYFEHPYTFRLNKKMSLWGEKSMLEMFIPVAVGKQVPGVPTYMEMMEANVALPARDGSSAIDVFVRAGQNWHATARGLCTTRHKLSQGNKDAFGDGLAAASDCVIRVPFQAIGAGDVDSTNWRKRVEPYIAQVKSHDAALGQPVDVIELTPDFCEKISKFERVNGYCGGYAPARQDGEWKLIDKNGDVVKGVTLSTSRPGHADSPYPWTLSEGLIGVGQQTLSFEGRTPATVAKCGFVNVQGSQVIPCKYGDVKDFSGGVAAVKNPADGMWGYIDRNDSIVIPFQFSYAGNFADGRAAVTDKAGVSKFIDRSGLEIPVDSTALSSLQVVAGQYEPFGKLFDEERTVEVSGNKYWEPKSMGLLREDGFILVPKIYSYIGKFENGIAPVYIRSRYDAVEMEDGRLLRDLKVYGFVDEFGNSTITEADIKKISDYNKRFEK